ncbi:Maf family protein [Alphaproteobacteria bacterium]|nr:Maf family protein [Alphaproteobacteria bacterium]
MINNKYKFVLASSSERRLSMLSRIGYKPDLVVSPNINESINTNEKPSKFVSRLALNKAEVISLRYKNCFILAADTVIVSGGKIYGKAKTKIEAFKTLKILSGKRHKVYGGLCVISPSNNISLRTIVTQVSFRVLEQRDIESYLSSGEWKDKAGCYAIQGIASKFVKRVNGNYDNIVGLSLIDADKMLKGLK